MVLTGSRNLRAAFLQPVFSVLTGSVPVHTLREVIATVWSERAFAPTPDPCWRRLRRDCYLDTGAVPPADAAHQHCYAQITYVVPSLYTTTTDRSTQDVRSLRAARLRAGIEIYGIQRQDHEGRNDLRR
ncbi:MAG: hypothetical protein M1118_02670 [Chloroflexi bacterium]|nr:hypothetical protein [Chloroflexota bacterium]